jgi:hypothetical protein
MPEIADDPPLPVAELIPYQRANTAWVITHDAEAPIAYLIAEAIDPNLHIQEVWVHPRYARHLGRRLIDDAATYAHGHHLLALTLATFTYVAWNAPYDTRCGCPTLTTERLTPWAARDPA